MVIYNSNKNGRCSDHDSASRVQFTYRLDEDDNLYEYEGFLIGLGTDNTGRTRAYIESAVDGDSAIFKDICSRIYAVDPTVVKFLKFSDYQRFY